MIFVSSEAKHLVCVSQSRTYTFNWSVSRCLTDRCWDFSCLTGASHRVYIYLYLYTAYAVCAASTAGSTSRGQRRSNIHRLKCGVAAVWRTSTQSKQHQQIKLNRFSEFALPDWPMRRSQSSFHPELSPPQKVFSYRNFKFCCVLKVRLCNSVELYNKLRLQSSDWTSTCNWTR